MDRKNIISIANRVQNLCSNLAISLNHAGIKILHNQFFDTLRIFPNNKWEIAAENEKMNFRKFKDGSVGISLDESTTEKDILKICKIFNADYLPEKNIYNLSDSIKRVAPFLDHEVFNKYHSETEMLRYIHKLR